MEKLIRNIDHSAVLSTAGLVQYLDGQIVSKTLTQTKNHSLTLFAFDKGEEISSHASGGDALVLALDGVGKITIGGTDYTLTAGEMIVMPAGIPHAVFSTECFKMLLTVIFPEEQKEHQ